MITFHLSDWLGKKRMTQKEVAILTGIRPATVSAIYHDKIKRIEVDHLNKLCEVFDCQPGDLMSFKSDPTPGTLDECEADPHENTLVEQEEAAEKFADPLDEPIELLNLDPEIFLPIRRTFREAKTVRDLLGKDFGIITGMGAKRMEILRKAVKDFTGEDVKLHNSRHKGNK